MPGDQYQRESGSLSFPSDTVVGIIDDPADADAAVRELVSRDAGEAGEDGVGVLCGQQGAERLDPSGELHGAVGKLHRVVQLYGDMEQGHVRRQADELRAGHYVIAAPAGKEEREDVARILRDHGGYFIQHYGEWTVESMDG